MKRVLEQPGASWLDESRFSISESDLARRELIARVVQSPPFARSERLASLLQYVCDMTLKGREREINEQKIGQAVFGRALDYDSAVDGIVRTQASRLRQRLDLYFDGEGSSETTRIVIPRGAYIPVFEPRNQQPRIPAPLPGPEPASPESIRSAVSNVESSISDSGGKLLPWILCTVLTIALLTLVVANRNRLTWSPFSSPDTHPLWSQIFSPNHSTLIVPGDSGLVLYQGLAAHETRLDDYLRGDYRTVSSTPLQKLESDLGRRRYTSIVDLEAATTLTRMAIERRSGLVVRYSRDVRPNDLKSGNMILVGAAEANPWVGLFERNMNFVFSNNFDTHTFSVLNRSPRPNEPHQWDSAERDPERRVYGVVAFVPNLADNGNALILEGTSMSGTEAAWDFVRDDSQLLPFLHSIRRPDGTIPHFELILGTNNMGASAVRTSVLAWRTIG